MFIYKTEKHAHAGKFLNYLFFLLLEVKVVIKFVHFVSDELKLCLLAFQSDHLVIVFLQVLMLWYKHLNKSQEPHVLPFYMLLHVITKGNDILGCHTAD